MLKSKKQKAARDPQIFGYARVSTGKQKLDRQIIALEPFGIPKANLFVEKLSGKDFDRREYKRLLRKLRKGDLVYFCELDRLGRNYNEIMEQWRYITREIGADIIVLEMPLLDTTLHRDLLGTFVSDLILTFFSFIAQKEREKNLQRQAAGIAAAKAKGVVFGRRPVKTPDDFEDIYLRWREGEFTSTEAAKLCGFCVKTLYNLTIEWRRQEAVN